MSLPRVIAIDDEPHCLSIVAEALAGRYEVHCYADARKGLAAAITHPPALLLLDIDMPGMSGIEVCEEYRATMSQHATPIIFLTSDMDASTMQRALRAGANDYLFKPFRVKELTMRIEFRLGQVKTAMILSCGNLTLDPATSTAKIDDEAIRLTSGAFRILQMLMRNEDRILTREQLLQAEGQACETSDRSVDLQISRLRKILQKWDHTIEAIYGKGYIVSMKRTSVSKARANAA